MTIQDLLPVNIVIPVFNRPALTEKTILSLRENTALPHVTTVVDNGSGRETRELLAALKDKGFVDHLFRLPRNYGVACASNVGWRLVDAPTYMKLDNDIEIIAPGWLEFVLHSLVKSSGPAVLGADFHNQLDNKYYVTQKRGLLGACHTHISGGAILIPRGIRDVIGYWSEDYGLYGCEDGDYGVRVLSAGFSQYYFSHKPFMRHLGGDDALYAEKYAIRKKAIQEKFRKYFITNAYLIQHGHRSPNTPMRYKLKGVKGCDVEICPAENAQKIWKPFQRAHRLMHDPAVRDDAFIAALNALITAQNAYWNEALAEVDASYAPYAVRY